MRWILLIFTLLSCSHVETLNLEEHSFGKKPKRIVWFQIAGFTEEHLAMLRFGMSREDKRTAFEEMSCSGKVWSYNLFDLRPSPHLGLRSQLLGSPNVKGTCDDFKKVPIWVHLNELGYQTEILENSSSMSDIEEFAKCGFTEDITIWSMNPSSKGAFFHYKEKLKRKRGKIYYDKSCQRGECHTGLYQNAKVLEDKLSHDSSRSLFIIRDFSYYQALKERNILAANEILLELEKSVSNFISLGDDVLVLVTSTASLNVEFPRKGKEWSRFVREGKGIVFRNSSLISTAMAKGPGAENFCGIFRESEIVPRLFWMNDRSYVRKFFSDLL